MVYQNVQIYFILFIPTFIDLLPFNLINVLSLETSQIISGLQITALFILSICEFILFK